MTVTAGGKTVTVPVKVENGVASPSDLTLHEVRVTVVEAGATPEKVIAGATVTAGGQSVTTGADGVATLYLVGGVTYRDLKAEAAGYTAISGQTLAVDASGNATPSRIELAKAGSHSVNFTVDKGATVTVSDPTNGSHAATAGPNDTQVSVPGVPDVATGGTVTVTAGGKTVTVPVKVENGVATPSDLTLHEVRVTVVEQGATPEKAIAGATVTVGGQEVTADGSGEATLRLVVGVTYKDMQAEATGYTGISGQTLAVDGSGNAAPSRIELAKAGTPGVALTVNGGAKVTIVDDSGAAHGATDTDGDGTVTVPGVPDVAHGKVKVELPDGTSVEVPVTVASGVASPSDLTLHPVTVKVVEQGATPEKVIAGAKVTVGGQEATANGNGEATLRLVKEVTYNDLKAEATGYVAISNRTLAVDGIGNATPSRIELAKAGVSVTVDGGATVTLVDADGKLYTETDTDGDGRVTLPNVLVPTTGSVTVTANGHTVKVPVTVDAGGNMTPSDLKLYEVTVIVVEQGTTTGIANAKVTIGGQEATAGSNGKATLHLVKGVTYKDVTASAAGYTPLTAGELEVQAGQEAQIELAKAGQSNPYLHVFVVDENLQAIDKVSVSVERVGFESTDLAGHVAWQLAANNEYKLTLKKEGYVTVTTSVWLEPLGHDLTVVMQRVAQEDPKKEDPKGHVTAVESVLLAGASLYPNPAREYTTLQGLEHAERVSILTLSGVEVQRLAVPGERERKLDVSSLAEGIYLVVLETRGGERRTLKLVVRR